MVNALRFRFPLFPGILQRIHCYCGADLVSELETVSQGFFDRIDFHRYAGNDVRFDPFTIRGSRKIMDFELERLDAQGPGVIFHGDPDGAGAFRGQLMEAQGREKADHCVFLSRSDQRKILVGFQRGISDAVNPPAKLDQTPFAGELANADPVHRSGPNAEDCARFRGRCLFGTI
jgi:hypothetical protein